MKRVVLYDCGRLMARVRARTPTGIDRVDFRYLDHFLHDPETTVIPIAVKRRLVRLYSQGGIIALHRMLSRRWFGNTPFSSRDERQLKLARLHAKAADPFSLLRRRISGSPLPAALSRLSRTASEEDIFYVNTSHHGMINHQIFEALRTATGARMIFYVHDMIPLDFPEYVHEGHAARHGLRMEIAARRADLILTNSAYSRDRFAAFCHANGLPMPEPVVLHIGVEPEFLRRTRGNDPVRDPERQPYFVVIGTIEPRKNHMLLLRVWDRLRRAGAPVPQLRIIGKRGWVTQANAQYEELLAPLQPDVVEMQDLDDQELMAQLRGAEALLFPSFTEGWGMPLVEALATGIPVIASDIPAFREASQDCATLLDPNDPDAWVDAVRQFADPAGGARLAALSRLRDFKPPTWEDQFSGFEAALAERFGSQAASQR